ncbi:SRPBCC family protein [Mycobacterium sp. NPDC006124]|uniref:SRPBCC family protein n=1 Tax=Mycobacterium sp. NPDC006124 TaxID=3156729 RepID=UPI0033B13F73
MRYRDQPTVEVTRRIRCDRSAAWEAITDIGLPARCSSELRAVEWLGDVTRVALGARFRGTNENAALGSWQTECEVVEVDEGRRWVWQAMGPEGPTATWGFEVEPTSDGVLVRQWARMGPGRSGLSFAIDAKPDLEARIVARRLQEWERDMQANVDCVCDQLEKSV